MSVVGVPDPFHTVASGSEACAILSKSSQTGGRSPAACQTCVFPATPSHKHGLYCFCSVVVVGQKWCGPTVVWAKSGKTFSGPKVVTSQGCFRGPKSGQKWSGPKVVWAKSRWAKSSKNSGPKVVWAKSGICRERHPVPSLLHGQCGEPRRTHLPHMPRRLTVERTHKMQRFESSRHGSFFLGERWRGW